MHITMCQYTQCLKNSHCLDSDQADHKLKICLTLSKFTGRVPVSVFSLVSDKTKV